ncbi:SRPBCC family protein [Amnibacterium setariae]|uniref:SRPBCC family protein n=1 Tax=Amnibacterium setariae TaxID=2306585 RepID=A0A3A1U314_9MICO|nr:SRPBCC family protein [Amnibacterium setariae]
MSTVIRAPRDRVVGIARDPDLLPRWAGGLAQGEVQQEGDGAFAVDSPMGRVRVVFAAPNPYGVLDHDVTLPDGSVTRNPFRILEHPDGAEAVFTLRQGVASDADFERDAAAVTADLARLKSLAERRPPRT